jgi:TonB family protein
MRGFLRILAALVLLAFAIGFNVGLVDIRLDELNYLLGKVAREQDAGRTLNIVAKYELIKRRMEKGGEADMENYELEARIQALTSGDQLKDDKAEVGRKIYLAPVRLVLDGIRLAMGKQLVKPKEENKILDVLEIGYFWERTRKYPDAIKIYDKVLTMPGVSPEVRSAVLIHKAFCHSMMSEYKTSKNIYERIIHQYPETEAGMLSWKLLDFITSMEEKRERVEKQRLTDFEQAKRYYMVMDYRNAIKYFSKALGGKLSRKLGAEAHYFKGRAHEELGETEEATLEYRGVIRDGASRQWAREANRRMLMLGEFYASKKKMAEEARKQLAEYQDEQFTRKMDELAALVEESSIRGEIQKTLVGQSGGPGKADEELLAMIDEIEIGDLDLDGSKKRKEELEKMKARLSRDGASVSKAKVRELKRQIALSENPYRRASHLKETIDGNAGQLRYLYNRRLRRGAAISGKLNVRMEIEADGKVGNVRVAGSTMGDPTFEKQVAAKVANWRFKPVPDSLGSITVTYPFEFHEEQ